MQTTSHSRHVPKEGIFGRSEGAAGSGGAPHYYVPPQIFSLWTMPVSPIFWLLRVESHVFSHAEKERAEQIHKMTTIFTQNVVFLSENIEHLRYFKTPIIISDPIYKQRAFYVCATRRPLRSNKGEI